MDTDPTVESPKTFNTPDPKNFMRNGKIAALPRAVRETLNRRLRAGHSGPEILAWLKEDEATQIVLTREFGGRQINLTNLSEWRHGGYREWEMQQLAYENIVQRNAKLPGGGGTARHPLGEEMANLFAAELMSTLHTLMVMSPDPETRFHFLNRGMWLIRGWRKADCQAARQALEEEKCWRKWNAEDRDKDEDRRPKSEGKEGNIQHSTFNAQHSTSGETPISKDQAPEKTPNTKDQTPNNFQPSTAGQAAVDTYQPPIFNHQLSEAPQRSTLNPQPARAQVVEAEGPINQIKPDKAPKNNEASNEAVSTALHSELQSLNSAFVTWDSGLRTLDSAPSTSDSDSPGTRDGLGTLDSADADVPNNTQIIANLEGAAEEAGLPLPKHNSKERCLLIAFLSGEPTTHWNNKTRDNEIVEPPAVDPRLDPESPWHPIYKYMIEQQQLWEELKHDWPGK